MTLFCKRPIIIYSNVLRIMRHENKAFLNLLIFSVLLQWYHSFVLVPNDMTLLFWELLNKVVSVFKVAFTIFLGEATNILSSPLFFQATDF